MGGVLGVCDGGAVGVVLGVFEGTTDGVLLGFGDEFGIGSPEDYSIKEIAEMFGGKIEMLPERKGNRMIADVITAKTEALDWKAKKNIKDYIEETKKNNWK